MPPAPTPTSPRPPNAPDDEPFDEEYDDLPPEGFDDLYDEPEPRITFSGEEMLHLGGSILVLSVAFAIALACTDRGMEFLCSLATGDVALSTVLAILPWSILIVITGFMLHELAHKIAAQRMHMWAEFRASPAGLGLALVVSSLTGIVLAAPGAVQIYGRADDRQVGWISIVGPAMNLLIGFACVPFIGTDLGIEGIPDFFQVVVFINAFLAAFNMLPVSPLDGSKVWRWSKLAYLGTVALIVALFIFALGIDLGGLFGTSGSGGYGLK